MYCDREAPNSLCYSSNMFWPLKFHYQGVTAVKHSVAYINIQLCIYSAKLCITIQMWNKSYKIYVGQGSEI